MSRFPPTPVRCIITRGDLTEEDFQQRKPELLDVIRRSVEIGIELVQVREKQLDARRVYELAREAAAIATGTATRVLVNERFDIALAARAHGVHLTSRSIPVRKVRSCVPDDFLIGVSAHSKRSVRDARLEGADYAMLGNIFETPGKGEPLGLAALAETCASADGFPVIAVGGIDGGNCRSVLEAGAAGFAAIRYLNEFVTIGK